MVLPGRVVHVRGADSAGVPDVPVLLHRIGRDTQGPIDTTRTDRAGRFTFRVARADTLAIYTTSTDFGGIGYFGEPVQPARGAPAPQLLAVYDTTSGGAALGIGLRHVIVARPDAEGNRRVLDIVQIANKSTSTRISRDSLTPTWAMTVPPALANPVLGQSDVPPNTVTFDSLRLLVMAPIEPGTRQVAVSYTLPGRPRRFVIPVDQPTERVELLIEDSTASVEGMEAAEPIDLDGRAFRRFGLDSLRAGRELVVEFGGGPGTGRTLMWVAIAIAGIGLLYGLRLATVRRAAPVSEAATAAPATAGRDALLAQIVALDERYEGRQADVGADEWDAYQKKRALLKQELARLV